MGVVWSGERATAFQTEAITKLAVLRQAAEEGRGQQPQVFPFQDPVEIPGLLPDWTAGPVVLIDSGTRLTEYQDLAEIPRDLVLAAHAMAAVDLFWWAHRKKSGQLLLTRLKFTDR